MESFIKIIKEFNNARIVVIGDVMLDEYIFGDVTRISPEAPVPILNVKKIEYKLGGAANTALNIKTLTGNVTLFGVIGNDEDGKKLKNLLHKKEIQHYLFERDVPTIKKTRIIAESQQVIRVDYEIIKEIDSEIVNKIFNKLHVIDFDVIVISDYAKGMITARLMEELKKLNKPIIVDPKPKNKNIYHDVFIIKPNLKEAIEMSGKANFLEAGTTLSKELRCNVVLTKGKEGISLFSKGNYIADFPTKAREVYDVTGAGDTVTAVLALCTALNASLKDACILANYAAGIAVSKIGTAEVTFQELVETLNKTESKIKTLQELKAIVNDLKLKGKKIVFTNGCFDILHIGHIKLLKEAKKLGDVLIVGLNTDQSVKRLKGKDRPINNQQERAEVLAALDSVDYIVFFDEDTPINLIKELKPDIHVKGKDYENKPLPEKEIVESYNGKVVLIDLIEGKSTSNVIEKIKNSGK